MFKKKNIISKLLLKLQDRNQYKQYKWELKNYTELEALNFFTGEDRLDTQEKIVAIAKQDKCLNIMHSGNAGDVVYALPTIKKIREVTEVPINLYIRLNQPLSSHSSKTTHPGGGVMINQNMGYMLIPLLKSQDYISNCEIYSNQKIHINLDFFRSKLISMSNSNLARWCSYVTGFTPDLWKSWLKITPDLNYNNTIILARSERYRNISINYSFLRKYKNIIFIGIEAEYQDMKKAIPDLQTIKLTSFLQLAEIIAGCKLFIGNQSLPYAIAEGLKIPRILEVYYHEANVIPEGENAHDFYFQNHFESLVKQLS